MTITWNQTFTWIDGTFYDRDIIYISVQNNINTSTSMAKFFFTIMSAFAEMEAELIRERVLSCLDAAKAK